MRRLIFDRLPESIGTRKRVKISSKSALYGAAAYPLARNGFAERQASMARRALAIRRNQAREGVLAAVDLLLKSGKLLDETTIPTCSFSLSIDLLAKEHGITCASGKVSRQLTDTLTCVSSIFAEPFTVPEIPAHRTTSPEGNFDLAIAAGVGKALSVRGLSQLIADLRAALDLPPATQGAIAQRIRDRRNAR